LRQNFKGRGRMKKGSLLLAGGMKREKSEKVLHTLQEGLLKRGISVDIEFVNLFEKPDLEEYEEKCILAVHAGTGTVKTNLPVVPGLALLYPWMGIDKLYDDICRIIEK
jgi:hypothetical protein